MCPLRILFSINNLVLLGVYLLHQNLWLIQSSHFLLPLMVIRYYYNIIYVYFDEQSIISLVTM